MYVFNGIKFVEVNSEKGIKVKAHHDHDWLELIDGTWIQSMRDGRYYDKNENLYAEAYVNIYSTDEEFELSGLFFKVDWSITK